MSQRKPGVTWGNVEALARFQALWFLIQMFYYQAHQFPGITETNTHTFKTECSNFNNLYDIDFKNIYWAQWRHSKKKKKTIDKVLHYSTGETEMWIYNYFFA